MLERVISTHAPSTGTALPVFAFAFAIATNGSTMPRSFAGHGMPCPYCRTHPAFQPGRHRSVAQAILPVPQAAYGTLFNAWQPSRPRSFLVAFSLVAPVYPEASVTFVAGAR